LTPNPSLVIKPVDEPTIAPQGTTAHFDIYLPHTTVPLGMPVTVIVSGANSLQTVVFQGFGISVPFFYTGENIGNDTIIAYATVDDETVVSNQVPMQWTGGLHTTLLSLNGSPSSGPDGGSTTPTATLLDLSVDPALPVPNASVTFTIGAGSCTTTTDANGVAMCSVALGAPGVSVLSASFAGTTALLPATATVAFHVLDDRIFADGFDGD